MTDIKKLEAQWTRVADTHDRAWEAYKRARERLATHRGQFAAEQRFIDTGQAVARAQARLNALDYGLRRARLEEEMRRGR